MGEIAHHSDLDGVAIALLDITTSSNILFTKLKGIFSPIYINLGVSNTIAIQQKLKPKLQYANENLDISRFWLDHCFLCETFQNKDIL